MLLSCGRLDVSELQGATQADVLVAVDADFTLVDGDLVVYEEPSFPVVELAWSLLRWVHQPDRGDFVFESMSFEEVGRSRCVVRVRGGCSGRFSCLELSAGLCSGMKWSAACARLCGG